MFAPKKWIGKLVALLSLAAGATVAVADDSAKGYEERPTYVRFTMNLGDRAREVRKAPWTEDETEGRDDFAAVYNPAPFFSSKAPTVDTGGLFQTEAPPITVAGFNGVAQTASVPPDPAMAAGPSDLAIAVNSTLNVRNYAGVLLSSQNITTLLGTTQFISDPNIEYDTYSGRFIGTVIAVDNTSTFANAKWWIFYSDNSTALGGWTAFSVNARLNGNVDNNIWADYPHIALTNDAVCLAAIMFATPSGSGDSFGKLRFMDKADIYDGGGITWIDFWNLASDGTPDKRPVPATSWDSPTRFYVMTAKESGSAKITVREFDDTAGGNNGAQTTLLGTHLVDVASYATPPDCRQPGGTTPLDNIDCRILQAEVANGDLFAVHTTAVADGAGNASAIKAYKLNLVPGQTPTVQLDNILFASGLDYCYPGITGTSEGAAVITFGRSGASENPSMRVTGFKSGATGIESSATVKSGLGTYNRVANGRNRWGDYFCCARSPLDLRTVWMHGEYAEAGNAWGTWVAASKFDAYNLVVPASVSIQSSGTGTLSAHVTNSDTFANVSGSTVSFYVNSVFVSSDVTDASGNASVPYTVAAGTVPTTRTILAVAGATASTDSNSGTSTLTITKADTAIQVASEVGVPGQTISLLAQLKRIPDNQLLAGETVAFVVNGNFAGTDVTDANGFATVPYTIVNGFGSYPIVATFVANTIYNGDQATSALTVNKGATTLTVPAKSGAIGSNVTLTATLTRDSDNTGLSGRSVTFSVGGVAVGTVATNASGVASFNWSVTSAVPGVYALAASFAGDASYLSSSGSSTFTRQSATTIAMNSVAGQRTSTVTFQATLRRTFDNTVLNGKTINWTVDGVAAGSSVTNASGIASLNYVVPAAAAFGAGHSVNATFPGDALNTSQSNTVSWQVLTPSFNGRAAFLDWVPTVAGQIVQITVRNSADVIVQGPTTVAVNASGQWQLFTTLGAGTYKVSVKGSHWLRKQVTGVVLNTTTGTSTINTSLINGDGVSDNVIDLSDYTQVVVAFNSAGPSGDLNGDGIVDLSDYTVVVTNFNLVGDP